VRFFKPDWSLTKKEVRVSMNVFFQPEMTEKELVLFREFIEKEFGIRMPDSKKMLLQSRLSKRLRELNLKSFNEYFKYLTSDKGKENEFNTFVDLVSTHVTKFFREPNHFEYIFENILPDFVKAGKSQIRIWSSASSTGEEAYSIAIIMEEFISQHPKITMDYEIVGTDISMPVIDKAKAGVYNEDSVLELSRYLKYKYFMKSKDRDQKLIKVVPEIRKKVNFRYMNLMDDTYSIGTKFNIVFCRNVLIYFDKKTQEKIIKNIINNLKDDGYLILGHSETIIGMDVGVKNVIPTIYKKSF